MQQGKRAIVIGASSGIGLEVAKLLIEQGWTVGVAARRVELLQGIGAAAFERIDVTTTEATEALQSVEVAVRSSTSSGEMCIMKGSFASSPSN